MIRLGFGFLSLVLVVPGLVRADTPLPATTYEILIDGESYTLQLERQATLESRDRPGTRHTVVLRIAPQQRVELNQIAFLYDWPAQVVDDHGREHRTARLTHELGFTITLTDMGRTFDSSVRDEALKILTDSVLESLRESKVRELKAGEPHDRKFAHCEARGVTIRYQDKQEFAHTCVAYLLTGPNFAATAVVHYFDKDADNVLPRIKNTLESVQTLKQGSP